MSQNNVALSSTTAKTDALSTLTVAQVSFTTCSLQIQNASAQTATFRIKSDKGVVITAQDIQIAGNGTAVYAISNLTSGSTYSYSLERLEFGTYVSQSSSTGSSAGLTPVTTARTTLSISTATSSALAKWTVPSGTLPVPEFVLLLQAKADFDAKNTNGILLVEVTASSTANFTGPITGLTAGTQYTVVLLTRDRTQKSTMYPDGFAHSTLDMTSFTTSQKGSLSVMPPKASNVDMSWTGDAQDFYRVLDNMANIVIPEVQGPSKSTIYGLLPGHTYTFILQIRNNGVYVDQASTSITTPSTTLTVAGVSSSQFNVQWTSIYAGAQYVLQTSVQNSTTTQSPSTQNTTATSFLLTGLAPNTSYMLSLFVVEAGKNVALGSAPLGTGEAQPPSSDPGASMSSSGSSNTSSSSPAKKISTADIIVIVAVSVMVIGGALAWRAHNTKTKSGSRIM